MAGITTYTGDTYFLQCGLKYVTPHEPTIGVFATQTAVVKGDAYVTANYLTASILQTPTFVLTSGGWTYSTNSTQGGLATGTAQTTFTFLTTATTITAMGYGVYDTNGNNLLWEELFNGTTGFTLPLGGGTVKITPSYWIN